MAKGHKKGNLQNIPGCAAEFIELVIKKMRYRKKVRADVQDELSAHFEDELRNCATDKEKEQKAKQIIEQFGDVKLLAVLLRRAKKRCRPLWRTIAARTFQTVGMLILCLIVYLAWFLTGKPVITTDYVAELNRIVRPAVDESLNAAPLYRKAAELYEKLPEDSAKLLSKKRNEVTPEEKQLIEKVIADNQQAFELIIAGTHKPYYWRKYSNRKQEFGMMGILLPHLSEFRKLAHALRWRAWLKAEQGRYEDTFDDVKTCYKFGQHLKDGATLIEQLVGIAIRALSVGTIRDILSEYQIDSATLAELQQDLERIIAKEDFVVSVKFEKLTKYDEIQRCFSEDRFGGGHLCLEGLRRMDGLSPKLLDEKLSRVCAGALHILFTHPNKRQSKEMVDRLYAFYAKIAHKTPAQLRIEGINVEEEAETIIKGNILLEILLPALWRVNEIAYRVKADVEATLAIIALLRYKQDKGNYPNALDDLIQSGYLEQLSIDPWSDKPLVYKKTDDGFILYGVGSNFKDDGGQVVRNKKGRVKKYADEGDWVFWPVPK